MLTPLSSIPTTEVLFPGSGWRNGIEFLVFAASLMDIRQFGYLTVKVVLDSWKRAGNGEIHKGSTGQCYFTLDYISLPCLFGYKVLVLHFQNIKFNRRLHLVIPYTASARHYLLQQYSTPAFQIAQILGGCSKHFRPGSVCSYGMVHRRADYIRP